MAKKKCCKSSLKHNQIVLYFTVKFGDLFTCDPNPYRDLYPHPRPLPASRDPRHFKHTHHNVGHSPSVQLGSQKQKKITQDCSRIAKEIAMMSGIFGREQEADIALFLQETIIRKIRKIFEENCSIIARNRAITSNEP